MLLRLVSDGVLMLTCIWGCIPCTIKSVVLLKKTFILGVDNRADKTLNLSIIKFTWGLRMALRIWRTASWASANLVWASTSCSIWLWWFTWGKLRNCDIGRGLALGVALFTSIRLPSTTAPCRALCADAASSGLLRLTNPNPFDPWKISVSPSQ